VAVKIKLKRLGAKRNPQYRIVVADARSRRDGRAIEEIGLYHPKEEPSLIRIDGARAQYWLGVGAQPTEAVQRLLEITGDWQQYKGLPGGEGTLRVAEPKVDKRAVFAAAAQEAAGEKEKFAKEQADRARTQRAFAERAQEQAAASGDAPVESLQTEVAQQAASADEAQGEQG
jgi:small subunit ribosomal protein S16